MLRRLAEFHRSTIEFLVSSIALIGPSLGIAVHCAFQVYQGNGLDQFRLGFVDIPSLLGAGASYMDVLLLDGAIVMALIVGTAWRWHYFRHERDFFKKYKIKGKTGFWGIPGATYKDKGGHHDHYDGGDTGD